MHVHSIQTIQSTHIFYHFGMFFSFICVFAFVCGTRSRYLNEKQKHKLSRKTEFFLSFGHIGLLSRLAFSFFQGGGVHRIPLVSCAFLFYDERYRIVGVCKRLRWVNWRLRLYGENRNFSFRNVFVFTAHIARLNVQSGRKTTGGRKRTAQQHRNEGKTFRYMKTRSKSNWNIRNR